MDVETAIRTRRTHKAFGPEPLAREQIEELLELARWAPNHHLTAPWRFRVVGPRALARLKEAAGPEGAAKLDRAPTLVVVSCALGGDAGAGRGGPARDRGRLLHRPARRARPRPRRLLAHARPAALGRGPRRGRPARRRALRRPAPPRPAACRRSSRPSARRSTRRPPSSTDRCSPARTAIEEIAGQRFEVVVIGGGITGAGVALDAASRGYSVALLERGDYAVGTSSRSSKMVHGGLRYLQNFDLGLVREALLERQLMVQLAPHLVYPTPFLVPAFGEERARPQTRPRAEHVRRDGDDAGRPQPPRDALLEGGGRGLLLVARPPPHDRPRGAAGAGARRSSRATPATPTSSTTARPTTCGWC